MFLALSLLASMPIAFAQATFPNGPNPAAVATYHSIGLYWFNPPGAGGVATVRFKEVGTPAWSNGLDLWYDSRNTEYRGSLVELKPGTTYDIELTLSGAAATLQAATWSEKYPIGSTIIIPSGSTTFDITTAMSGTASGYTLVTAPPGENVIIGNGSPSWCIRVRHNVHHVIIRGLVLQDCTRWGVFFEVGSTAPGTSDIVVEDNQILGWGGFDTVNNKPQNDGAVHCNTSASATPARLTVQRNKMHDPRYGSNPWGPNNVHPAGAQGVMFGTCGSNHVFRYNEIYSTGPNPNHYNDGMGGCCNFSIKGFPFADSDIYGNRVSQVYDDGIEAEGANRNVRIWANFIDRSFVAIANGATVTGPLYVWRNVSHDMALMKDPSATDEGIASRGPFVKAGSNGSDPNMNGGRAYYFHNTTLQPASQQSQPYPRSAGFGINDSAGSLPLYNFVSLNNIWQIHRVPDAPGPDFRSIIGNCDVQGPCAADYDLYNGRVVNASNPDAPEVHGFGNPATGDESSVPTYAALTVPSPANGWSGNFSLETTSRGYGGGVAIPNFNGETNVDPGAHQSGTPPMVFGTKACVPYYSSCRP